MDNDVDKYIKRRKKTDKAFADGYEAGYQEFKIGYLLRNARTRSGITQEELA
jgi:HTH-type transcriptional regulator/antitoxin HipB